MRSRAARKAGAVRQPVLCLVRLCERQVHGAEENEGGGGEYRGRKTGERQVHLNPVRALRFQLVGCRSL